MTLILILTTLLTTICVDKYYPSDKELIKYVKSFEKDNNVKVNYSVRFVKRKEKIDEEKSYVIGYCVRLGGGKLTLPIRIQIYTDTWRAMGISKRLILLYHELGHCSLGLDHIDDVDEEGCPINIMNSVIPSNYCISKYGVTYYLQSLKKEN